MVSMSTNELWTLHNTDIRKPIEKYKSTGKSIVFTWFHSESKDIKKIDSKAGDICFIRGLLWVQGHLHEKANSVNEGKIAYKNDHKLFCSRSIPFKGSNAPLSIKCVYILYIYKNLDLDTSRQYSCFRHFQCATHRSRAFLDSYGCGQTHLEITSGCKFEKLRSLCMHEKNILILLVPLWSNAQNPKKTKKLVTTSSKIEHHKEHRQLVPAESNHPETYLPPNTKQTPDKTRCSCE